MSRDPPHSAQMREASMPRPCFAPPRLLHASSCVSCRHIHVTILVLFVAESFLVTRGSALQHWLWPAVDLHDPIFVKAEQDADQNYIRLVMNDPMYNSIRWDDDSRTCGELEGTPQKKYCLPSLFLAGFQHCGSTTLFNLLASHPQLAKCSRG